MEKNSDDILTVEPEVVSFSDAESGSEPVLIVGVGIDRPVLRQAMAHVRAARAKLPRYRNHIMVGTLRPDNRLSNGNVDIDAFVLRNARRRFGIDK